MGVLRGVGRTTLSLLLAWCFLSGSDAFTLLGKGALVGNSRGNVLEGIGARHMMTCSVLSLRAEAGESRGEIKRGRSFLGSRRLQRLRDALQVRNQTQLRRH